MFYGPSLMFEYKQVICLDLKIIIMIVIIIILVVYRCLRWRLRFLVFSIEKDEEKQKK